MDCSHEINIQIFGGCHVMSYGAGFVDLLKRSFPNTTTTPHVKAAHLGKVFLQMQKNIPDIAIFQIGNYENPYPIFDRCVRKFAKIIHLSNLLKASNYPYVKFVPYKLKIAADKFLNLFGYGVADSAFFRKTYQKLLQEAISLIGRNILVIGPFPSPDPWIDYGRSRANSSMRKLCKEKSIHFLDVFSIQDFCSAKLYGDVMHLNSEGHQKLYETVLSEIQDMLTERHDE